MRLAAWGDPLAERIYDSGGRRNSTVPRKLARDEYRVVLRRPPIDTDVEGGETDRCRYDQEANHEAAGTREAHCGQLTDSQGDRDRDLLSPFQDLDPGKHEMKRPRRRLEALSVTPF